MKPLPEPARTPDQPPGGAIEERIRHLVPLNALADDLFQRLLPEIHFANAARGEYLFKEGDKDHENLYLLAGRVVLFSGDRQVDQVVAGSSIARFPLAHQWPRRYSARAADGVQYIRVDSRLLSDLLVRTQEQSYRVSDLEAEGSGDWMSQVLRSRLFEQIPPANIQNVLRRMEEQQVGKGEVVIRQGDQGEHYFVMVRGRAVVTRSKGDGVEVLAHLDVGDGFGEDALISGRPCSAAVTMTERGILARLGRDDFLDLVHRPLSRSLNLEAGIARAEEGAVWLDVRPVEAFAGSHLPGAIHIPMESLRARIPDLDGQREYLVGADDTGEAAAAAFVLVEHGLQAWALDHSLKDALDTMLAPSDESGDRIEGESPEALQEAQERPLGSETRAEGQDPASDPAREIERLRAEITRRERDLDELRGRLAEREADAEALRQRGEQLEQRVAELKAALDESEQILQEASAEESAQQWERMRLQARIEQLEQALSEQKSVNAVLEEENAEILRRIEALQQRMEPQAVEGCHH